MGLTPYLLSPAARGVKKGLASAPLLELSHCGSTSPILEGVPALGLQILSCSPVLALCPAPGHPAPTPPGSSPSPLPPGLLRLLCTQRGPGAKAQEEAEGRGRAGTGGGEGGAFS